MFNSSDNPLESLLKKPPFHQLYDQNPIISKQDDSPFFSNFPSPFFDEHELPLHQILLKPGIPPDQTAHISSHHSPRKDSTNNGASSKLKQKASADAPPRRRSLGAVPRKRTGKKDRHSKICTAQGIRDRRMRLSLQVARKFFDIQDMLGYDKASKTIEWLFNKSKKAIKDLINESTQGNSHNNVSTSDGKSESFISECEVVSGIEENSNNEIREGVVPHGATPLCSKGCQKKQRKTGDARESREKARARARSRAREKLMIKGQGLEINSGQWRSPNQEKLGSSKSPFEQESGTVRASPYDAHYCPLVHQSSDVGTIEKLLGNYHCSGDANNNFMGFLGNWDLLNNDRLNSSQDAVTDQMAGNPNSIYSETSGLDFPLFDHQ